MVKRNATVVQDALDAALRNHLSTGGGAGGAAAGAGIVAVAGAGASVTPGSPAAYAAESVPATQRDYRSQEADIEAAFAGCADPAAACCDTANPISRTKDLRSNTLCK